MNANKAAEEQYIPEAGDIAWLVIKFLKENDDEELTAIDVGVKFDIATDLVAERLRRATVNEYLRRSTNKQGAPVWKLGARPLKLPPLSGGVFPMPVAPQQRYANRVSLPTIQKGVQLQDAETRRRTEINAWLAQFEPGDSVTFASKQECDDMRKSYVRFRKDHAAYYFEFVEVGDGQWGMQRRAEAPKLGRKKGEPAPVRKKK